MVPDATRRRESGNAGEAGNEREAKSQMVFGVCRGFAGSVEMGEGLQRQHCWHRGPTGKTDLGLIFHRVNRSRGSISEILKFQNTF